MVVKTSPQPSASRRGRRLSVALVAAGLAAAALTAGAGSASAAFTCDPGGDTCVVVPDQVQTPAGVVTVTLGAGGVVTVRLSPASANTLVLGVPFAIPPGPPGLPAYTRTTIATAAGEVDIDAIVVPPGPPGRLALPSVAVVSIHPPGPCRARTTGTQVVFTPVAPAPTTG